MAEQESVYLWSTTALTNASADPAVNFAEGQLPGTLNNSNRAVMTAVARFVKDTDGSLTTAGSANAYTLTINGRQTAYATGHVISFKASFSNTGAATLNVTNGDASALGAKAIRLITSAGDAALIANNITSGGHYILQYDIAANSAAGAWLLLNPTDTVGQIPFPATQNASADANTLDDYEEGTWTPGITFGGASVGVTTSTAAGRYTKQGNRVVVSGLLTLTSKGSSAGNAAITGLPFTVANNSGSYSTTKLWVTGAIGSSAYDWMGLYLINSTTILIYLIVPASPTNGHSPAQNTDVANTTQFSWGAQYEAA